MNEKRIDELKEKDVFEFHSMPNLEFEFIKFYKGNKILVFKPVATTLVFTVDKSGSDTVFIK